MSELYTNSRLSTFRRCMRLHHYRYVLGIQSREPSRAADFGTAGHYALERSLLARQAGEDPLAAALAAVEQFDDLVDRAKLRALIVGYHHRWQVGFEVLAVEQEFRFMLDGVMVGGKLDAVVRDLYDDGRTYVLEHKFTGADMSPGSAYWDRLTIDTQCSIYFDGANSLGYDVAGIIYDVVARPRHEPAQATPKEALKYTKGKGCKFCGGKAEARGSGAIGAFGDVQCKLCNGTGWADAPRPYANMRLEPETLDDFEGRIRDDIAEEPDKYYKRGIVVRLDDEVPRMRADLLETVKLERVTNALGMVPRNPSACNTFGSMCSMFEICAGRADVDDLVRYPRGTAHPELPAYESPKEGGESASV